MNASIEKRTYATVTATKIDRHSSLPSMTVSTDDVDRDGDRVYPKGGFFKNYLANPVLCWAHDRTGIPIGSVVSLSADENGVRIEWRWLENDPLADRVKNAWDQRIVRAASLGFIPKRSTLNEFGGHDHVEWELIEVSLVPVPCNPAAVRTLKSLNLWQDDESEGEIHWGSINRSLASNDHADKIDWAAINSTADVVNVDSKDVLRVIETLEPAMKNALRAGLRGYAEEGARKALLYMSGRLD